jgi:DNA-binding transcriptional LysR family regulator
VDIDQVKTFLAVVAHGSFLEAAQRVHVTQSTVSARIRGLEQSLNTCLFVRNRSGATLTQAGRRFLRHAKTLVLTVEQARHDVGLPSRFTASLTVGARIALWDGFLPRWVGRMRALAPDVSITSEIGFEEDLMRRMVEGTLDLALMYTPLYSAGLRVEHLFDETLVLVTSDPERTALDDGYVYVAWGPTFYSQHQQAYPDLARPAQMANIGWLGLQLILANGGTCFVPDRIAAPYLAAGSLHQVPDAPCFHLPAYMVYPVPSASPVLEMALATLRDLVFGSARGEAEGLSGDSLTSRERAPTPLEAR